MGCKTFFCTGVVARSPKGYSQITGKFYPELENAEIIPSLSVDARHNKWITSLALRDKLSKSDREALEEEIDRMAGRIEKGLQKWLRRV